MIIVFKINTRKQVSNDIKTPKGNWNKSAKHSVAFMPRKLLALDHLNTLRAINILTLSNALLLNKDSKV